MLCNVFFGYVLVIRWSFYCLASSQLIEHEAIEVKNKFPTPRRSFLEDTDSGQLEEIDVIPNEEMLLVLGLDTICTDSISLVYAFLLLTIRVCNFKAISEKGYAKRMKPNTFNLQHRGTIGKSVGKLRVNDTMSDFLVCHAHDHVLYFRYLSLPKIEILLVYQILSPTFCLYHPLNMFPRFCLKCKMCLFSCCFIFLTIESFLVSSWSVISFYSSFPAFQTRLSVQFHLEWIGLAWTKNKRTFCRFSTAKVKVKPNHLALALLVWVWVHLNTQWSS